jgi:hypothetical protein
MDARAARARGARTLAKVLDKCGEAESAKELYKKAWDIRKEVTGTLGSGRDTDEDYNNLLFYWDI